MSQKGKLGAKEDECQRTKQTDVGQEDPGEDGESTGMEQAAFQHKHLRLCSQLCPHRHTHTATQKTHGHKLQMSSPFPNQRRAQK